MNAFVVLVAGLGAAGILPALVVARRSPVVVFLAPVIGGGLAAVAALIELGVGGSLPADYLGVAVVVNLAVIVWWLTAGRPVQAHAGPRWWWGAGTAVVVLGCLAIPLNDLRVPAIGGDPNVIYLTHALLAYAGHHVFLTRLPSAGYTFSHPDYPPLVPAAEALAFKFYGLGNLHLAVDMTLLLTACVLGAAATGVAAAGNRGRRPARIAGIAAAGALCIVGFAVSGIDAAYGYVDLLWAAAATGAVIWGLVLPCGPAELGVAWICASVASLTKNEGLAAALVILVLIALRYRPLVPHGPQPRGWVERAAFVILPALPGLAWAGLVHLLGMNDYFFAGKSRQPLLLRAGATVSGIAAHLAIAPVALAVLLAGCWFLRRDRERARLGNPAWLWVACLGYLVFLFATYVVGQLNIHGWLATSVSRTTTFAQLLLYAELAIWLVLSADGLLGRRDDAGDKPSGQQPAPGQNHHGNLNARHLAGSLGVWVSVGALDEPVRMGGLLAGCSLEAAGKDIDGLDHARALLPPGTRFHTAFVDSEDLAARMRTTRAVMRSGFVPVPVISARRLESERVLSQYLGELRAAGTGERVVVVGGDPPQPRGPYADAASVIASGVLEEHGVREVSVAGHPGGHPAVADAVLWQAITAKVAALEQRGLRPGVITQFGFDAAPVLAWLADLRARGLTVPVRVGVPGPATMRTLLAAAAKCDVSVSASAAQAYGLSLEDRPGTAGPDRFIRALEAGYDRRLHGEIKLHFTTFRGVAATAEWITRFRHG